MINLIPPQSERALTREYWFRVSAVWMLLLGTGCLVVATLFLPSYMLVNRALKEATILANANSASVATYDTGTAALTHAMNQAKFLTDIATNTPTVSVYDNKIRELAGGLIKIQTSAYTSEGATTTIVLSGTAATRQSLADYKDALLKHPYVTDVTLPLSSLIRDRDLLFSMTIYASLPQNNIP